MCIRDRESATQYRAETGRCLYDDLLANELAVGERVIFRNEHFTVFLPFFTEYPYGVYVMSNRHCNYITEFSAEERVSLADTLRQTAGMLDALFDYKFPYMMCMHNAPVNLGRDVSADFHFHIEFFPPMRSADKQKFNASSETGVWAHCNPTKPEEAAKELRAAHARFLANHQ